MPPKRYAQSASTCDGLLAVPSSGPTTCEITNQVSRASFLVTKACSNTNSDEVEMTPEGETDSATVTVSFEGIMAKRIHGFELISISGL